MWYFAYDFSKSKIIIIIIIIITLLIFTFFFPLMGWVWHWRNWDYHFTFPFSFFNTIIKLNLTFDCLSFFFSSNVNSVPFNFYILVRSQWSCRVFRFVLWSNLTFSKLGSIQVKSNWKFREKLWREKTFFKIITTVYLGLNEKFNRVINKLRFCNDWI